MWMSGGRRVSVCVCVCVCERERGERERTGKKKDGDLTCKCAVDWMHLAWGYALSVTSRNFEFLRFPSPPYSSGVPNLDRAVGILLAYSALIEPVAVGARTKDYIRSDQSCDRFVLCVCVFLSLFLLLLLFFFLVFFLV